MLDKKFGDRSPQKRRFALRLKIYGVLALFFLFILGIAWLIVYSPVFKIQKINVSLENSTSSLGVEMPTDNRESFSNDLISSAKNFILAKSKIARYLGVENILSWDNNLFANFEFSGKYPQVSGIVSKRDFTKREVDIEAKRREKLGIWCLVKQDMPEESVSTGVSATTTPNIVTTPQTENCYWFDREGVIFSVAPEVEGDLIYRVDDYTGRALGLGDEVLIPDFFGNLVKIFGVMESAALRSRSFVIRNLSLEEIDTNPETSSSPVVYFSLRNDPGFAAEFLKSVEKLGLDKSQYLDLRVENRVYYK